MSTVYQQGGFWLSVLRIAEGVSKLIGIRSCVLALWFCILLGHGYSMYVGTVLGALGRLWRG
jgi:hypothetical protein